MSKSVLMRRPYALLLALALVSVVPVCVLAAEPQQRADNVPPEGFVALFDAKGLAGWKGLVADPPKRAAMAAGELAQEQEKADARMREHWKVADGVLISDSQGENLCTAKDYGDFELLIDWKTEPTGDSGIYLRGSPQVQIWDKPEGSGALWNNKKHANKPLFAADRPAGEWNTFRIIMVGERATIYVNDVLVVDDTVLENYWEPEKPIYPRGAIELQSHKPAVQLQFKNIFIRELVRPAGVTPVTPPLLKPGDRVVITGDSITEQKIYSRFIEDYLLACVPQLDLTVTQLGWSGERAPGFADRMDNDLLPLKPSVVTTCYGMNDGLYKAYEPVIGEAYEKSMRQIVERLKQAGAIVLVGSPGAVDLDTFKRPGVPPAVYNDNLAHLRDVARELAFQAGEPFADVHDQMILAMRRAKPVLGPAYHVCGPDGFHPAPDGQLVMAYAFLKGLGLDGDIGTITVEWNGEKPKASDGHTVPISGSGSGEVTFTLLGKEHKIASVSLRTAEIESTRYPFCFYGDPKLPDATRSILPYLPFNADLNRFTLIVKGLPSAAATVKWGDASQRFTREQLEAGVNLAAEFLDNPFSGPFKALDDLVAKKQAFETSMIKQCITNFRTYRTLLGDDAEAEKAMTMLRERLMAAEQKWQADVRAAVTPVRHTLTIEPEK